MLSDIISRLVGPGLLWWVVAVAAVAVPVAVVCSVTDDDLCGLVGTEDDES